MVQFDQQLLLLVCIAGYFLNVSLNGSSKHSTMIAG